MFAVNQGVVRQDGWQGRIIEDGGVVSNAFGGRGDWHHPANDESPELVSTPPSGSRSALFWNFSGPSSTLSKQEEHQRICVEQSVNDDGRENVPGFFVGKALATTPEETTAASSTS